MPETDAPWDFVVSLQRRDAANWRTGHLAAGLLVDQRTVLVPDPPKLLYAPDGRFDVLLVDRWTDKPATQPETDLMPPGTVKYPVPSADGRPAFAVVKLARATTRPVALPEASDDVLNELCEKLYAGDGWPSLVARGLVPGWAAGKPPTRYWSQLPARPRDGPRTQGADADQGRPVVEVQARRRKSFCEYFRIWPCPRRRG
jgi:hypothetical protein